jgi:poly(3-hydroxybutyrate) depolymerase
MKNRQNSPWKFLILLCLLTLVGCRLRQQRDQAPAPSATPPPIALSTTSASPATGPSVASLQYVPGRNDYQVMVEDTPRQFIIHVPDGYDPSRPTPVVIVLHGSNHTGSFMYESTAWVDKAEKENILAVFPSSWKYFTTEANSEEEKWNVPTLEQITLPGTELKDDVHFMQIIVERLKATFNVDEKRIFATGGSNGGVFVMARLIPQMNDTFAAYATTGALLLGEVDVNKVTLTINASLYNVLGTQDAKVAEIAGLSLPFPFQADEIINDPDFGPALFATTAYLGLDHAYTVQSEPESTTFTFSTSSTGAENEYRFRMVRGMGHIYPSGDNNRAGLNVSDLFWDFFMRHAKP